MWKVFIFKHSSLLFIPLIFESDFVDGSWLNDFLAHHKAVKKVQKSLHIQLLLFPKVFLQLSSWIILYFFHLNLSRCKPYKGSPDQASTRPRKNYLSIILFFQRFHGTAFCYSYFTNTTLAEKVYTFWSICYLLDRCFEKMCCRFIIKIVQTFTTLKYLLRGRVFWLVFLFILAKEKLT